MADTNVNSKRSRLRKQRSWSTADVDYTAVELFKIGSMRKGAMIMNTKELIEEILKSGTLREKKAVLKACNDSVLEYAAREFNELYDSLSSIDRVALEPEIRSELDSIMRKITAVKEICRPDFKKDQP